MLKLSQIIGFDWNKWNIDKNWIKHKIKAEECEQIFFNQPLIIYPDLNHSEKEKRSYALGRTIEDKLLFVVFSIRKEKIRIISAHKMNKKEQKIYEQN
jgi:uncharacterized DUF497 family protein